MIELTTTAALWWAVVGSGIYHGVNPGMGWPLAVSAALMERSVQSLFKALSLLALGHLAAMMLVLLPFSALVVLADQQRAIQIGAAVLVIGFGLYLLINRRHPRILARIHPTRLAFWSFLAALAHGAGLMIVPIYLGICRTVGVDAGHTAADALMDGRVAVALGVATAHTLAMVVSGGMIAFGVYRWIGLKFLSRGWFNLDVVWALSLVATGVAALVLAH